MSTHKLTSLEMMEMPPINDHHNLISIKKTQSKTQVGKIHTHQKTKIPQLSPQEKQNIPFRIVSFNNSVDDSDSSNSSRRESSEIIEDKMKRSHSAMVHTKNSMGIDIQLTESNTIGNQFLPYAHVIEFIKYETPSLRIHHNQPTVSQQNQLVLPKHQTFNNSFENIQKDTLERVKKPLNLLTVQGRRMISRYQSEQLSRPISVNVNPRGFIPLKQRRQFSAIKLNHKQQNDNQLLQLIGKAKQQVKNYQFFKMPKERERVLDLKLRQRIKSDMISLRLKNKLMEAQKRANSQSKENQNKTKKKNGYLKLMKIERSRSAVKTKKETDLALLQKRIKNKGNKKLILR